MKTSQILSGEELVKQEYICKHNTVDKITRWFHSIFPLSIQHIIRDYGGIRWLSNSVAIIVGLLLGVSNPSLIFDYIKVSSLTKRIYYDSFHKNHFLDIINMKRTIPTAIATDSSVLVFVYGGAWGSGHTWMYRLCAYRAALCLRVSFTILIEYSTYPTAKIDEQVTTISQAISYIKGNPSIIFGTKSAFEENHPTKFMLMGHSSGANISALAIHRQVISQNKWIDIFIPLSGVFDIREHYKWEEGRGLHQLSPMSKAADSFPYFDTFSPTLLTQQTSSESYRIYFPFLLLIHGLHDYTVPITSSIAYAKVLLHKGIKVWGATPQYDHMNPILDLTLSTQSVTGKLLQEYVDMITSDSSV